MGLTKNGAHEVRPLPATAMIALVVPLCLLLIAIRRHSGVLAAFLLLVIFATRI